MLLKYVQDHILVGRQPDCVHTRGPLNEEACMPYPTGHSAEVRARIVQSARRLFNRHGFENVSLKEIMAGAGLTHGGFYSYFGSKSDLYSEVLGCFFTDPEWKSCWEGVHVDLKGTNVGPEVVRAYLSRQHYENVENSCPMAALPGDVARCDARAKQAFETVFKAMVSVLERSLSNAGRRRHDTAQAVAALCVGGMVVARAMLDRGLADDLREGCMGVALELGGWAKGGNAKRDRTKGRRTRTKRSSRRRQRGYRAIPD
jgi:TetR/AcrR family transcriptional regulator, transcriptional repressor for nem operon